MTFSRRFCSEHTSKLDKTNATIRKALSELCVGFNQGLRRGRFVEL